VAGEVATQDTNPEEKPLSDPAASAHASDDEQVARVERSAREQFGALLAVGEGAAFINALDRRLEMPPGPDTYSHALEVGAFFGLRSEAFSVLTALVQTSAAERREQINELDWPAELVAYLHELLSRCGDELAAAADSWRRRNTAHEWIAFRHDAYKDRLGQGMRIEVEIRKRNRTTVILSGESDSIVRLAANFIDAAVETGAPGDVDDESASRLSSSFARFQTFLEESHAKAEPADDPVVDASGD